MTEEKVIRVDDLDRSGKGFTNSSGSTPRRFTAIVKPTLACNLKCVYCYEGGACPSKRMNLSMLEQVTSQTIEYVGPGGHVNFLWHGGEPLLAGLGFYQRAVELQKRMKGDVQVENTLQTNGSLMNREWAEFFAHNEFKIGFSLDGGREIHNITRPAKGKQDSFEKCYEGIQLAREYKIGGRGAIAVITKSSLPHMEEIYTFFRDNDMHMQISPTIKSGRGDNEEFGFTAQEFGGMMISLFDRWFDDPEATDMQLRPLEDMLASIAGKRPTICTYQGKCRTQYIAILPSGDIYPCGRFHEDEFKLGNIEVDGVSGAMNSERQQTLLTRNSSGMEKCAQCEFRSMCNGGCMHNAYLHRGDPLKRDGNCEGLFDLYTHLKNRWGEVLEVNNVPLFDSSLVQIREKNSGSEMQLPELPNPIMRRVMRDPGVRMSCLISDHSESRPDWSEYQRHSERYAERWTDWSEYDKWADTYDNANYT